MATSGKEAFYKYYFAKEVDTVIRKITETKPSSNIQLFENVTVHDQEYSRRLVVTSKVSGNVFSIDIGSLKKPGRSQPDNILKPQNLNLCGRYFDANTFVETSRAEVSNLVGVDNDLKEYLDNLISYCNETANSYVVKHSFQKHFPLKEIVKDFGEIIGPVKLFKDYDGELMIPEKSNYALLDYWIGTTNFSAKTSAGCSNIVKPADILNNIDHSDWRGSPEYEILSILNQHTVDRGPIKACEYLGIIGDPRATSYDAEKCLIELSKTTIDFSGIFRDAISSFPGEVHYVKLKLDKDGLPHWNILKPR